MSRRVVSERLIGTIDFAAWMGGSFFQISSDSQRVTYAARVGAKQFVVVDGKKEKYYDAIVTTGGGRVLFDPENNLRYLAGKGSAIYVALVGIGHLGNAVARHEELHRQCIRIAALFDCDPHKIGARINGMPILDDDQIPRVIRARGITLAIIAVPARYAQAVADRLIAAGVHGILNYAPIVIQVPEGVWVRNIDPVVMLQSMTYYLARDEATHVGT